MGKKKKLETAVAVAIPGLVLGLMAALAAALWEPHDPLYGTVGTAVRTETETAVKTETETERKTERKAEVNPVLVIES